VSLVSCTGSRCSVKLVGEGSRAKVFDTTISFRGVKDGRATLRVGDKEVSCAPGEEVSSGRLRLKCTAVLDDGLEFTASPL
jgi:hypothetical protein